MFINNKYFKWYNNIVSNRLINPQSGEIHHIVPKCMGGTNNNSNLVKLAIREHFICHWILTKCVEPRFIPKCSRALLAMSTLHNGRRLLSSKQIAVARKIFSDSRKGVPMSEATKTKLSALRKGKKTGSDNHMFGKTGDKHHLFGGPGTFLGKLHSDKTKEKMSRNNIMKIDRYAGSRVRWTRECREAHSNNMKGQNNNNAKSWKVTKDGQTEIVHDLKEYCKLKGWNYKSLHAQKGLGKPYKGHLIEIL